MSRYLMVVEFVYVKIKRAFCIMINPFKAPHTCVNQCISSLPSIVIRHNQSNTHEANSAILVPISSGAYIFLMNLRCRSCIVSDFATRLFPRAFATYSNVSSTFTFNFNHFRVNVVYGGCYFSSYFHLNARPQLCKCSPCTYFFP